jgi:hypothetical protein
MPDPAGPRLGCYMNWLALDGLAEPAEGWPAALLRAGYDGVQFIEPLAGDRLEAVRALGLGACGSGRVNTPAAAYRLAEDARRHGLECLTLHVGWGHEEDEAAFALIDAVLDASARHAVPLYVETHRATLFQDLWRSVRFTRRFPQLLFNGDFSHWYMGLEMVYGGFDQKLAFIQPIIERTGFLHGRIGDPGCIQVDIGDLAQADALPFVGHFRTLWTQVFSAFLRRAEPHETFCFATELLGADIYYARRTDGVETSDRWSQSLVLAQIARQCFEAARTKAP